MPPVLTFVHRADVPKTPETITLSDLQQQAQLLATRAPAPRGALEHRRGGLAEAKWEAKRDRTRARTCTQR